LLGYGFWISPDFKEISAGVAIFLFGMLALEEGFKAFTGGILERILRQTTDRLWKSLSFGVLTTTIMQSSSLVSVITISFLSAGLIGLASGIGIIFGANLGTTTGAWLVAGFGLKVKISAYAMPMLVFGVILIFQQAKSLKGVGYVLAGLGFLFLGIHHMKEGFESFKDAIDLSAYAIPGFKGLMVYTLIGVFATVVMQSSHATLVLIITALAAQQISYENALALAIGANVGTTITAIIGSMGSNVDGRRLAAAHLIFNLTTGALAIIFIQQFLLAVNDISGWVGIAPDDYTLKLAVFHTLFNLLGILVMLPFTNQLVVFLEKILHRRERGVDEPRFLNEAALEMPDAALEAVRRETGHLFENAFELIAAALNLSPQALRSDQDLQELVNQSRRVVKVDIDELYERNIKSIYSAITAYISRVQTQAAEGYGERLYNLRLASRNLVEAVKDIKHLQKNMVRFTASGNREIRKEYNTIREQLAGVLREILEIESSGDLELALLSLDSVKVNIEANDILVNGNLDRLIRDNQISAEMATSLMNDNAYAYDIADNLINMARVLFAPAESDLQAAEESLALDMDEIEEVLRDSEVDTEMKRKVSHGH
jgi:phosphate:Na+ symporter